MASRYWVGGSGTWDATTTHWSATSGGASGASVPTSADDVFFDAASGAVTCTLSGGKSIKNLDCTGFTGTLATGGVNFTTFGTLFKFVAGMTVTGRPGVIQNAAGVTNLMTTAGKQMGILTVTTGGITLQDDYDAGTNVITLTAGTLNTNDKTVTAGSFSSSNANVRTLTLGASAINLSNDGGAGLPWTTGNVSNLTLNAGTSTITMTGSNANFTTGVKTFNNVVFTPSGASTVVLDATGATFANVTVTGFAGKVQAFNIAGNTTITGTLTVNGNSAINRTIVKSNTIGTTRILTVNTAVTVSNVDFTDIAGAGAASWNLSAITGGSGDAGGNSGITFTTAATQTHTASAGGNWSDATKWTSRVPLPQDDVVVNANTTGTLTGDMPRLGKNIDYTGFVGTATFTTVCSFFGSMTTSSGMATTTGGNTVTFAGRDSYNVTSNGFQWKNPITISAVGGTYTLADDFSTSNVTNLNDGTLALNGHTYTTTIFTSTTTRARTLAGPGTIALSSTATATIMTMGAGMSVTAAPNVTVTVASANARTIAFGSYTYGTLDYTLAGSTGGLTINGSNSFDTIKFSDASNARTLTLASGATTNIRNPNGWQVTGTTGKLMSVVTSTAGSPAYVNKTLPDTQSNHFHYFGNVLANAGYAQVTNVSQLIYCPDASLLDIVGDLEGIVSVALDDWTPAGSSYLFGKHNGAIVPPEAGYYLVTATVTGLTVEAYGWSIDGSGAAQVATGSGGFSYTDGSPYWVRVTHDVDNGAGGNTVNVYRSADPTTTDPASVSWSAYSPIVTSGVTSIYANSQPLLLLGLRSGINSTLGKIYKARILNGIGGTVAASPDFTAPVPNVSADYMSLKDVQVGGSANWYAGSHSTDVSGNTGWTFTDPPSTSDRRRSSFMPFFAAA